MYHCHYHWITIIIGFTIWPANLAIHMSLIFHVIVTCHSSPLKPHVLEKCGARCWRWPEGRLPKKQAGHGCVYRWTPMESHRQFGLGSGSSQGHILKELARIPKNQHNTTTQLIFQTNLRCSNLTSWGHRRYVVASPEKKNTYLFRKQQLLRQPIRKYVNFVYQNHNLKNESSGNLCLELPSKSIALVAGSRD